MNGRYDALAALLGAEWIRHEESMGLVTQDLRARYHYWNAMRNAEPLHDRWSFRPGVTMGNCTGEPWQA